MQAITLASYVCIFASSVIMYTYATVGGQYSVNVHFVPPLHTAQCQIAQFWSPQNVTCALCFCMTGSLSRCIPQPGCRPGSQNSTMMPSNSTQSTEKPMNPGGNGQAPQPEGGSETNPPSRPDTGAETTQAPPTQPPPSGEGESVPSKVRKPKGRFFLQNDDIMFQNDLI